MTDVDLKSAIFFAARAFLRCAGPFNHLQQSYLISPPSDHRACLGCRSRKGVRLGYRPRLNCEVRGQLLPLDLGPASSSSWTRSVCRPRLASAPPRNQHLNPAHTQLTHAACTRAQPTDTARPLLLGRRRALETVDAEVDDAGSTIPSTAPAVAAVVSLATAAQAVCV
eukprot:scaffold9525_cov98-Phaeocystis_antarctica.AAC.2